MLLFADADGRVVLIHHQPDLLSGARRRQAALDVDALPDVPEHSERNWAVLRVRDGQAVYDVEPIPPTRTEREQAEALSAMLVARMVSDETLDATEIAGVAAIFPAWRVGIAVEPGDVLLWDGGLVECIQAHTTQPDWTPDVAPALWKVHRTDTGGTVEWEAGITVEAGETVIYEGVEYTVLQGHTTQEGWEPPSTPALWEPV